MIMLAKKFFGCVCVCLFQTTLKKFYFLLFVHSYTVILTSHEAIREAFVQRSVDFADRFDSFSNTAMLSDKGDKYNCSLEVV